MNGERAVTEWLPIETAPQDGRPILITGGTYSSDMQDYFQDQPFDGVTISSFNTRALPPEAPFVGDNEGAHDCFLRHRPTPGGQEMSAKIDAPAVIAAYMAAYLKANGRALLGTCSYERGWFVFRAFPHSSFVTGRYRAAQMRKMTERMNARWENRDRAYVEDAAMREDKK